MRSLNLTLLAFAAFSAVGVACGSSSDSGSPPAPGAGGTAGAGGSSAGAAGMAGSGTGGSMGVGGAAGSSAGAAGAAGKGTGAAAGAGGMGGSGTAGMAGSAAAGKGGASGKGGAAGMGGAGGMCTPGPIGLPGKNIGDSSTKYFLDIAGFGLVYTQIGQSLLFKAVPLDGSGPAQMISDAVIDGNVINGVFFFWTAGMPADPMNKTGAMWVWTPTGGAKQLTTGGSPLVPAPAKAGDPRAQLTWASKDGSTIVYPASGSAMAADLVLANVDGTGVTKIGTTRLDIAKCVSIIGDAGPYFVASACTMTGTDFYAAKPGEPGHVVTSDATVVAYDPSGKNLFAADKMGAASIFPLAVGGASYAVDTGVGAPTGGLASARFSKDGATVFYLTKAGTWRAAPAAAPSTPKDIATGFKYVWPYQYDDTHAVGSKAFDATNFVGDLFLIDNAAGTSVTISADTKSAIFGDLFTADGLYLLPYDKVIPMPGVGQLEIVPFAGGAAKPVGDKNGWLTYALTGSKISYDDNYVPPPMGSPANAIGVADIKVVDVSGNGPEAIVAKAVGAQYSVSSNKKFIVYEYTDGCLDTASGIYVVPVPLREFWFVSGRS
jgi:hypothetical protein